MDSFLDPKSNVVFAEEQFAHLVSNVNKMKADFVKTRSLLLGKHLSSFGIESRALKLYRFVRTVHPGENLGSIKIFRPALFKIFYTVENETVVKCYFFDDIINLIYHPSVITLIDYCNNTDKFSLQELLDQNSQPDNKVLIRNIHGLFRFLLLSPGTQAITKTDT
jgi:hypothetical protein